MEGNCRMTTPVKIVVLGLIASVIAFFGAYFLSSSRAAETSASPDATSTQASSSSAPAEGAAGCDTEGRIAAYSQILDNPGAYEFQNPRPSGFTGEYSYALVEMTGDDIPELLVEAGDKENYNPVRVFSAVDCDSVTAPVETLMNAAAGAGGERVTVLAAASGDRIYQAWGRSIEPMQRLDTWALQGQTLAQTGESIQAPVSGSPEAQAITFSPVADRAPLEAFVPTVAAAQAAPAPQAEPAAPVASGNTVTGTVRVFTGPELAEHQGLDRTPNGEGSESTYAVLVPDAPTPLTAKSSGNRGQLEEREIKVVLLGQRTPYSTKPSGFDLEGQHVSISFNPEECWFPSDAALPVGQPKCFTYAVN